MPEWPEVETIRRHLTPLLVGLRIRGVTVHRRDVLHGSASRTGRFEGCKITSIERLGKQLAFLTTRTGDRCAGPCFCVHLGMSGSLETETPTNPRAVVERPGKDGAHPSESHVHLVWAFDRDVTMRYRDPRRFGGVWVYAGFEDLVRQRWGRLGPDAMAVTARQLHHSFQKTGRGVKSCLLDQAVVAGLGNIYVDEVLHRAGIHPKAIARELPLGVVKKLIRYTRAVLRKAVTAGGSTIKDHKDPSGRAGSYQLRHLVYGRAGLRCRRCCGVIRSITVSGRTTAFCPHCQPG